MARRALTAAVIAAVAFYSADAWAVDKTFQPASGNWTTAGNWSPAGVPGTADRAIIPANRTATMTVSQTVDQIVVNGLVILQDGVILKLNGALTPLIDGTGEVRTPPNVAGPPWGTGRIEIPNAQTGMLIQQSIRLGNFWLNYTNSNPNTVNNAKMRINNNATVVINGDLNILVGNLEFGQNPPGGPCTVDIRGNVNIAGISLVDFKANNCICICGGNWTQLGTKFKDGTNTTLIMNGTGNQTFTINNPNLADVDYDNLILAGTGAPRTVFYLNNPQLTNGFHVGQNFVVGANVTLDMDDGVDPTANGGIGDGSATWSFRIEDNAFARFRRNYNNSARLLFRNNTDTGTLSNGVLRLEGTITDDSSELGSSFDPGVGTVEYAGQNVAQTVWTRINGATAISYFNLVIDNIGGVVATQEAGALLDVNANYTIRNAASIFTATTGNMQVRLDFIANGLFNCGNFTVTLDGPGLLAGTAPSLVFNNLFVSAAATDVRTAARNFTTNTTFQVTQGILVNSGAITMTALQGLAVGDGAGAGATAVLNMIGGVTLAVAPTRTFSVNAVDGRWTTVTSGGVNPTVTHSSAGAFTATVNGQANIFGLNFSFGDANGLAFTATSTIERLRNARFTNILAGAGTHHLTITSPGLDLDCPGCFFDTVAANQFNVWAVDSSAGGVSVVLRFENRTAASTPGSIGGPGAGETWDGDDDTNDDGRILPPETTALHGGAIVQWVYTANVDMTGAIQGFPMPAFDWNTFTYYSTYVLMRNSSGTTDSIYVLNSDGDLKSYSFTLPGVDIVGPLFWSSEAGSHFVYFGTSTGAVYRLIDNGSSLVPAGGSWSTPYTEGATLIAVTSPVLSDGVNLYFAGQSSTAPTFAIYKVVISTKTAPNPRLSISDVLVTTGFAWWDTLAGRYLYGASRASGGQSYIGRAVTSSWTLDAVFSSASLPVAGDCTSDFVGNVNVTGLALDPVIYLLAGEVNGYVHAVNAAGTAAQFGTQKPGFPFRDKVSAVRSSVIADFFTGRVFFGNDAGDLYTMGTSTGTWTLGTNYFRLATPAALPIQGMPLFTYGVLYGSNTGGKVYLVDVNNGAGGQTLFLTYNLGSAALGDISRDPITGRIYVASAAGRLHAFDAPADPTPGAP
jgi:hypothetical protein